MYNMYEKIGIIGFGYVGEAIAQSVIPPLEIVIIDPDKGYTTTYQEIIKECSSIFVCVPSPQGPDGHCDVSIVEDVFNQLSDYRGTIISKVTAPPNFYEAWSKKLPNLVYVPEFLTAEYHITDFQRAQWLIVGGTVGAHQREAIRVCKMLQGSLTHIELCDIGEAAFVKYAINSFLATKVVFMNELNLLAEKGDYDWRKLSTLISMDKRLGTSHFQVPGPDGSLGFGGGCFPKDTLAFLKYANAQGMHLNTLDTAIKKNMLLRLTTPK